MRDMTNELQHMTIEELIRERVVWTILNNAAATKAVNGEMGRRGFPTAKGATHRGLVFTRQTDGESITIITGTAESPTNTEQAEGFATVGPDSDHRRGGRVLNTGRRNPVAVSEL